MLSTSLKKSFIVLSSLAMVSSIIVPVQAQNMGSNAVQFGQWRTWKNPYTGYNMKLPSAFKLSKETPQTWQFIGTSMSMKATAWRSKKWRSWQVAKHEYKNWKKTTNKEVKKETDITRYIKNSRANGTMIEGTGIQNGRVVRFVFAGLSNSYTGMNMNLRFAWWDSPSLNAKNDKMVEYILSGIQAARKTSDPFNKDPFKQKPDVPTF